MNVPGVCDIQILLATIYETIVSFYSPEANPALIPTTMASTYHKIPIQTLTKAPIPAAFEFLGLVSLYTKNKTSPTTGIQHPKIPHLISTIFTIHFYVLRIS